MIRYDTISKAFIVIAVLISIYLSTLEKISALSLFPTILLISGLVLQIFTMREIRHADEVFTERTAEVVAYALIALVAILIGNLVSPRTLLRTVEMAISLQTIQLFGILMAVAEEVFFRGFLTNFFASRLGMAGVIIAGGIFAVFHIAVYGASPSIIVTVLIAGIVLSWVAWHTRRLSPTIIAHVVNNLMAV